MLEKFEEGMAVMWKAGKRMRFGVVVGHNSQSVHIVPVYAMKQDTKCYDKGGSNRKEDQHNVMLVDCPPPFEYVCADSEMHKCYAKADLNNVFLFSEQSVLDTGMAVTDMCIKISERDMQEIRDHLWRDEQERGRCFSAMDRLLQRNKETDAKAVIFTDIQKDD